MSKSVNHTYTKRGNRIHGIGKHTSKLRKGILTNYFDWKATVKEPKPTNIGGGCDNVQDLYYCFYDDLYPFKVKGNFGYIMSRNKLINPVGELYGRRYFLTDTGKKRLKKLKKKYRPDLNYIHIPTGERVKVITTSTPNGIISAEKDSGTTFTDYGEYFKKRF